MKFYLFGLLVLLSAASGFGQTRSYITTRHLVQPCNDKVRVSVWREIAAYESFTSDWNCKDKLRAEGISLGKSKGFIVSGYGSGLCGATGNCPTWVVAKRGEKYRIVLRLLSAIMHVDIKHRGTNNYPDLGFRGRMGLSDHYLGSFRFDGSRYRLRSCFHEVYSIDGEKSLTKAGAQYCR
jgi:hypothetical protein